MKLGTGAYQRPHLHAVNGHETHASVIELKTGVHADVDGAMGELASLRSRLADDLGAMGLRAAGAGTHPLSVRHETEVAGAVPYRALDASLRVLARREPTMALHVHVGVPAPEDAIQVLNGLRRNLSVLLALSANSPFWQGHDSGFASARTVIFQAFPRTALPASSPTTPTTSNRSTPSSLLARYPIQASSGGTRGCSRRSGLSRCG